MSDEHRCPRCNAPHWHFTGVNTRKFECGSDSLVASKACEYASKLREHIKRLQEEHLAEVERENERLKARAERLEKALSLLVPTCDCLHHATEHRHEYNQPCPVVDLIEQIKREKS